MRALPLLPTSEPAAITPPRSVRLSLTDRCDLACIYCRPHKQDGYLHETLDVNAWKTMVEGLVRAGVRRVRLTGGEPLLHPEIVAITTHLASLGLEDLALTTNGTRLARLAQPLRRAGLHRLNVSLDTLDAARFARMTRGGRLASVLDGIDAALQAGFEPVKLNAVVVRGENDSEIEDIVRWCWDRGVVPRLLEVMAIGEGAKIQDRVVTAAEMRLRLAHLLETREPERELNRGPAKYVRARHHPTRRVGFITGTSDTYCKGCDRLRVAGDGTLRPCLATNDGVPGGNPARQGDPRAVAEAVSRAWALKPDGETWKGCTETTAASVSIRGIGG
ncbi:MAG TPA: radical SAM protein [Polyangiaceae bacterium]|nr:radical SAM protein [Polyangiaceae bacterium]